LERGGSSVVGRFIYLNVWWCTDLQTLKTVDRQLSRKYFTSDVIYNGSAGMTLYYYMCRSWQDCCRRGENRSWPSVSVESVESESWCLNKAIFYAFIMRLTVEEPVFILKSYLKTMSYAHCRQSFFEKFRRQAPVYYSCHRRSKWKNATKSCEEHGETCR
jgi:hypothetical protein